MLPVEQVGREDRFFELGGHSLLAMQVIVRIRASLNVRIAMRALFDYPTVKALAAHVEELRGAQVFESATDVTDLEELLDSVAAMPERKLQELMRELTVRGTP